MARLHPKVSRRSVSMNSNASTATCPCKCLSPSVRHDRGIRHEVLESLGRDRLHRDPAEVEVQVVELTHAYSVRVQLGRLTSDVTLCYFPLSLSGGGDPISLRFLAQFHESLCDKLGGGQSVTPIQETGRPLHVNDDGIIRATLRRINCYGIRGRRRKARAAHTEVRILVTSR